VAFVGETSEAVAKLRDALSGAGVLEVGIAIGAAERPEILVVSGDPEAAATRDAVMRFIDAAAASRFPSEIWWLRCAGERRRLPEVTRRIQLRRLDVRPGVDDEALVRRWITGLRRGQCVI